MPNCLHDAKGPLLPCHLAWSCNPTSQCAGWGAGKTAGPCKYVGDADPWVQAQACQEAQPLTSGGAALAGFGHVGFLALPYSFTHPSPSALPLPTPLPPSQESWWTSRFPWSTSVNHQPPATPFLGTRGAAPSSHLVGVPFPSCPAQRS